MAILDRLKFDASDNDILVWKHPSESLRLGSQLIVNESQDAVFFRGGQALDVFGPGAHTLSSGNIPLIARLINLPFGGKTPFTAEVWFVNRTVRMGLKWGTRTPIPVLDPSFGYPISLRSFGEWGLKVVDARMFLTQLVGTRNISTTEEIQAFSRPISFNVSRTLWESS